MSEKSIADEPILISPPLFTDGGSSPSSLKFGDKNFAICAKCKEPLGFSWSMGSILVEPCIKCAMGDICE